MPMLTFFNGEFLKKLGEEKNRRLERKNDCFWFKMKITAQEISCRRLLVEIN